MAINPYLCRHEIFIVLHNQPVILTACIREDLPAGSFALEKGDLLPNSASLIRMARSRIRI